MNRNVFLNCPFDEHYDPIMRAILFAVVDCGFTPRCALERSDASEPRIQKIYRIIEDCAFGIHDVSRVQLDEHNQLPRFNMPLEFGIFLGAKFLGTENQRSKSCLVFDEKPYRYQMYMSDIAGQDIRWHGNDERKALRLVRDWLSDTSDETLPTGSLVWDRFETFQGELREACEENKQRQDELSYNDMLRHITRFRRDYIEQLDIQGDKTVRNPNATDIKTALRSVKHGIDNAYIILEKGASGTTYMQAILDSISGWTLEFQDGHLDKHFEAEEKLSTEAAIELFLAYLRAEDTWRSKVRWKPLAL